MDAEHEANLTKGMEHLRPYVSVPHAQSPATSTDEANSVYGVPSSLINPLRRAPERAKSPSNTQKRSDPFQFGSRYLEEGDDIFEFNAWDHVEVDDAFKEFAELQYQRQRESPVSDFDKGRFNTTPEKWWNRFYTNNASNFFKDRKWLFQEFPVLVQAISSSSPPVTILEVGAGAGNTAFPILSANQNPNLKIHACDFSAKAIDLIRNNPLCDLKHIQADVWDVATPSSASEGEGSNLPPGIASESVDIVILIFIFSALSPLQWAQAIRNIYEVLKPGGQILFRDYGRGDLAQVRFKKGRWLEENFYIRGDGTRVYFFDKDELTRIFAGNTEEESQPKDGIENVLLTDGDDRTDTTRPHFNVLNLGIDRRMLVNRQRKLKMYRCWMQGHFAKPSSVS